MEKKIISIALLLLFISCSEEKITKSDNEVVIQSLIDKLPNASGVLQTEKLVIPKYEDVIFYSSDWWPGGGNRLYSAYGHLNDLVKGKTGGLMLVFKLSEEKFMTYLAGVKKEIFLG